MIDLKERILAKTNEKKERPLNRFSCSKLYSIFSGWISPEQYVKGEEFDLNSAVRMRKGSKFHELVQELLPEYKQEVKLEHKYNDIILVGMADCLAEDHGLEIKTSDEVYPKAKPWHEHQARLYCTLFEKPYFDIVQPVIKKKQILNPRGYPKTIITDFYLKDLGRIKRNDKWFETQLKKLEEFYNKIKI